MNTREVRMAKYDLVDVMMKCIKIMHHFFLLI